MSSIIIEKLGHRYDSKMPYILRDLTLDNLAGKNVLVLGDNGTGKSTFGKLLTGILKPTEGKVVINSVDVSTLAPKKRILHAYYINQLNQLHFIGNTLRREIGFVEKVSGKKADQTKLADFYLPEDLETNPFELLTNQAWRLSLYLAAVVDPYLLFIDEIPSSANGMNNDCLKRLIEDRSVRGLTTFIAYQRNIPIKTDLTINF